MNVKTKLCPLQAILFFILQMCVGGGVYFKDKATGLTGEQVEERGAPQAAAKTLTIEAKSHKRSHLFNFWDFVSPPIHPRMHLHPTIFPSSFTPPLSHPSLPSCVQYPLILPCPPPHPTLFSPPPPLCLSPSSLYQRRFSPLRPSLLGNPSTA